jgi:hypothetical protein
MNPTVKKIYNALKKFFNVDVKIIVKDFNENEIETCKFKVTINELTYDGIYKVPPFVELKTFENELLKLLSANQNISEIYDYYNFKGTYCLDVDKGYIQLNRILDVQPIIFNSADGEDELDVFNKFQDKLATLDVTILKDIMKKPLKKYKIDFKNPVLSYCMPDAIATHFNGHKYFSELLSYHIVPKEWRYNRNLIIHIKSALENGTEQEVFDRIDNYKVLYNIDLDLIKSLNDYILYLDTLGIESPKIDLLKKILKD